MLSIANKTVVVIGGTSGIGFCVAEMALQENARVIVTGRDENRLNAAVTKLQAAGRKASGYVLDAADSKDMDGIFDKIGHYDHLVSMAGGFMGGGFMDTDIDVIRKAIEEKLFANLGIARAARPSMREGGSMVFTAGSGGRPHNASGAIIGNEGIQTLVKGLAVELAPTGRANAVAPTWTRTPLWRHMPKEQIEATERHFAQTIPLGRTARIEEVAATYLFLMKNSFVTGQTIAVDGGISLV